MRIGIIGTGYVGTVTGACLSEMGHQVVCCDVDESKIRLYSQGKSAIYEPGLEELLKKNLDAGRLKFTTDIRELASEGEIIFLCVGTPPLPDGSADLSQVETAVKQIAENAPPSAVRIIVEKSTVPVGTHKRLKNITRLYNKGKSEFEFVVNSEFLREGSAVEDFMNPDRIVIGVESERAKTKMLEIYKDFNTHKHITDPASAEVIKYASNSFLALKISFINMVSDLCEKTGGDVDSVADGMGFDKRIGRQFLNAGIGYGGSCFPKDVKAFVKALELMGVDGRMLRTADEFNQARPMKVIEALEEELWILKNKEIAIWGLAFKPDTDDIREAPALAIVEKLREKEVNLRLFDPQAMPNFKKAFPESGGVKYFADPMEAIRDAEALVVLTEWEVIRKATPESIYGMMKLPVVVDGRNIFDGAEMKSKGFRYFPIGKGSILEEMKRSK